jgi:phosphoserine phosphatase RsbX
MTATHRQRESILEWAFAGIALDGKDSGDLEVVAPFPDGALVGLIDGLGHGPEAAGAAKAAAKIIRAHAGESPLSLFQQCHAGIRNTRGVAMSLASLNGRGSSMSWLGVGNVEGILVRANRAASPRRESMLLMGGVVGYQLPSLRETTLSLSFGDRLVFATDGIGSGFIEDVNAECGPQKMADLILARHAKRSDDALVLVACYLGAGS